MAASLKIGFASFLLMCLAMQVSGANTTSCFQSKCRECKDDARDNVGEMVKCELRGIVSLSWLTDSPDRPIPGPGVINVDYSCLKMTASDANVVGDSTDVIKGCVLTSNAKNVCDSLIGEELARGKKDARCTVCTGELCNGAMGVQLSFAAIIVSLLIAKLLNH